MNARPFFPATAPFPSTWPWFSRIESRLLTSRETEVLQLLTEGQSTSAIAEFLRISVKTVETHRRQIMTKLDLHSVAELIKYAIRMGLTNLDP